MRTTILLSLIAIAGCGNRNDSIVVVTVTSATPMNLATVRTRATAGGRTKQFDLSPNGGTTVPTPVTYGIDIPHDITGNINLHVEALDTGGSLLGEGDGSATITPGGRSDIEISLGAGDATDMTVDLTGPGGGADMTPPPPDLERPATLKMDKNNADFGNITIGKTSSIAKFVISNPGSLPTGTPMMTTGGMHPGEFTIATDCNAPIQPLDQCHVTATLTAKTAGTKEATFTVSDGQGNSVSGELTGNALTPGQLSISPDTRDCGSALLNTTSSTTASFTVKNTGQTATGTVATSTSDSQFSVSGCNQALAPNGTCTLAVTFKPNKRGTSNASVSAGDGPSDPSPATASVTGVGQLAATVSISPTSYTFPSGPRQSVAGSQEFEATNGGDVPTAMLSASKITGSNAAAFSVTGDTCSGTQLAPAPAKCTVTVQFTPSFTGAHSATLSVRDASSTLQSAGLGGTGTPIWVRELSSSAISGSLRGVWAYDANHAWAVGDNQAIFARGASATWTSQPTNFASPPSYTLITGTGPTDLWAIDPSGYYRSTGDGQWKAAGVQTNTVVGGVFAFAINDVWHLETATSGVGSTFNQTTTAYQHTQSGASSETAQQGCGLMWGSSDSDLYCTYNLKNCHTSCVFAWGIGHRGSGGTWQSVYSGGSSTVSPATMGPIWGSGPSNIFSCASNARPVRYDGSGWVPVDPSAPKGVQGIWGSSATDVYFVGSFGVVHGDGSTWGAAYQPKSLSAVGVGGTGVNDVYVVGSDSDGMCIYHWF